MNKEIIAKRIVENKFSEICTDIHIGFQKSFKYKVLRLCAKLTTLIKILAITIFIFMTSTFTSNILEQTSKDDKMNPFLIFFLAFFYIIIVIFVIFGLVVSYMNITDFRILKSDKRDYYFDGLDMYFNKCDGVIETIDNIFSIQSKINFKIKWSENYKNRVFIKDMKEPIIITSVLLLSSFLIFFLLSNMSFINEKSKLIVIYIYIIVNLIWFLINVSYIFIYNFIFTREKNKEQLIGQNTSGIELIDVDYNRQIYHGLEFLQKVFVMKSVCEVTNDYKFINKDNFIQFLGQLAESTYYELTCIDKKFEYFSRSELFTCNTLIKEGLDMCVHFLSQLELDTLKDLDKKDFDNMLEISADEVLIETLISYNIFYDEGLSPMSAKFATKDLIINMSRDNFFTNQYFDKRYKQRKVNNSTKRYYILKIIDNIIQTVERVWNNKKYKNIHSNENAEKNNSYFRIFNKEGKLYGFVGYDSSYVQDMMENNDNVYSDYKTYQFVLSGESELIFQDDIYYHEGTLTEQLFYKNKLILSEKVLNQIKNYFEYEEIKVSFNEKIFKYYICAPKKYSSDVIDTEMSLFFESIERYFIKESILVEPCIIEKHAEKLKVFGVSTKRVINYNYYEKYNYQNIFVTNNIYEKLKDFEGVQLIRNARSVSPSVQIVEKKRINSINYNNEFASYESKYFKFITNDKYTYSKEFRKECNRNNIFTIITMIFTIILFLGINDVFSNFNSDYSKFFGNHTLNIGRLARLKFLFLVPLIVYMYNKYRTIIISPISSIKNDSVIHNIRSIPILGNRYKRIHPILKDDLTMAFYKDKVMFELPIENKGQYINDEIYYNGTSFALCGVEIKPEEALRDGEDFISQLHYVYYINNKKWLENI